MPKNSERKYKKIYKIRSIFYNMKRRCYQEDNKEYKCYGGRGIKICNEWLNDINLFIKWSLENGYSPNLQIDRINNDGNYEPSNCRWTTQFVQANNRRTNLIIEYNNKKNTLKGWCRELQLPYRNTHKRIYNRHWTIERAFAEKERVGFK